MSYRLLMDPMTGLLSMFVHHTQFKRHALQLVFLSLVLDLCPYFLVLVELQMVEIYGWSPFVLCVCKAVFQITFLCLGTSW